MSRPILVVEEVPVWFVAWAFGGPIEDAARLMEVANPRPAGSPGALRALDWVADELDARGWSPERWGGGRSGGVLACREGRIDRTVLFIAHVDSVHADCPGANDNAIAVTSLLALADSVDGTQPRRVCLAFPDGEELGFLGTRALVGTRVLPALDQVMALDLVGRGTVTHNGLGPGFSSAAAQQLLDAAPADVPWVYRAISLAAPALERSDHWAFKPSGVPASHLMARGESGVFWRYHTVEDDLSQLVPETVRGIVATLEAVARMEPLPGGEGGGEPWFVLPFTHRVVPGWGTWTLLALGLVGALGAFGGARTGRWRGVVTGPLGMAVGVGIASVSGFEGARATVVVASGWLVFLGGISWGLEDGRGGRWPAVVAAVLTGAGAVGLVSLGLSLLAVPVAVAAGGVGLAALGCGGREPLARWRRVPIALGVLCSAWPAAYLVRGDAIRELAFHGFVPAGPLWALIAAVLCIPLAAALAVCVPGSARLRRLGLGLAAFGILAGLASHALSDRVDPYDPPDPLWPERAVQRSAPLPDGGSAIP